MTYSINLTLCVWELRTDNYDCLQWHQPYPHPLCFTSSLSEGFIYRIYIQLQGFIYNFKLTKFVLFHSLICSPIYLLINHSLNMYRIFSTCQLVKVKRNRKKWEMLSLGIVTKYDKVFATHPYYLNRKIDEKD